MANRVKEIIIDKVSILTEDHEPAVEKAGVKYALLKSRKKGKFDDLQKRFDKLSNDIENKDKQGKR